MGIFHMITMYKAYLAITGAIERTSREQLYNVLGLQLLCEQRCGHKLFYKINFLLENS